MNKLMLCFVAWLLGQNFSYGCILTMQASDGLPPFFEKQHLSANWQGLGVDWLVRISQHIHCRPELVELPWGRALHMLQKGQLDLMTNLTKTKERELYIDFIGPHSTEKLVLLLTTSVNNISRLEDISQLKGQVAILANGFYGEKFQWLYQNNSEFRRRILPVSSSNMMKKMLNSQRVSGLIEDEHIIRQWQNKQQLDGTGFYPALTVNVSPVYIGLSKKALSQQQRDEIRSWWQHTQAAQPLAD